MNVSCKIFFCLFITSHVFAAQIVKPRIQGFEASSLDNKPFSLGKSWVQESRWLLGIILNQTQFPPLIQLPLLLQPLVRIDSLLRTYATQDHENMRNKLMEFMGLDSDTQPTAETLRGMLQTLDELYQSILKMELYCLVPFLKEALCTLLRRDILMSNYLEDPEFIYATGIGKDMEGEPVQFIPHKDLHFLRACLCTEFKLDYTPLHLDIDASGEYAVVCGMQKKSRSLLEVWDLRKVRRISRISLDYSVRGLKFYQGRKIIVWGDQSIDLWDTTAMTKITPSEWEKTVQESTRIWAVAVSDQGTFALGVDEKILLATMPDMALRTLAEVVSKKEKARSKGGRTALVFADEGKVLVELYKDGELYFYRCENGVRIGQNTELTDIAHYYPNGSKLITISSRREARIWNCQTGQTEQKGTMQNTSRTFVSYGRFQEVVKDETSVFCDTKLSDFIEKFVQGRVMGDTVEIGPDRIPRFVPTEGNYVCAEPRNKPSAFYISPNGSVCIGADAEGNITMWHYYDKTITEALLDNLTLTQGICLFHILKNIRSGEPVQTFLRKPHMRELFESLPGELSTYLNRSFSSIRRATEDIGMEIPTLPEFDDSYSPSSSSTSKAFFRIYKVLKQNKESLVRSSSTPSRPLRVSAQSSSTREQRPVEVFLRAQSDNDTGGTDGELLLAQGFLSNSKEDTAKDLEVGAFKRGLIHYRKGNYKEAYDCFVEGAAQKENPHTLPSMYLLGEMLLRGNGVPYDPREAVSYYEKVEKNANDELKALALLRLGEIHYYGLGPIVRSQAKALDYFNRILLITKPAVGCKVAAHFYLLRIGLRELQKDDMFHLDAALTLGVECESQDLLTLLFLGRVHLHEGQEEEAVECFLKVADSKDKYLRAEAWYRLGKIYFNDRNSSLAQKYFSKAVGQECNNWVRALAEVYLGRLCFESAGSNEESSLRKALEHYAHAKNQSYNYYAQAEACYWTARLYEKIEGDPAKNAALVFENDTNAVSLAKKTIDKQLKAHLALGQQFYRGTKAVSVNCERAHEYFKTVAEEANDPLLLEEACFRLADIYVNGGPGVRCSPEDALNLYERLFKVGKNENYVRKAQEVLAADVLEKLNLFYEHDQEDDSESEL